VDDPADGGELPVEAEMSVEVRTGAEGVFGEVAVEVADHHVLGAELGVLDAAGLDDDEAACAVDPAGVAEGEEHEAGLDDVEIGLENLLLELGDGGAEFGGEGQHRRIGLREWFGFRIA
jgi:hypothetical protein